MRNTARALSSAVVVALLVGRASAGIYSDGRLTINAVEKDGGYVGTITVDGNTYPLTATPTGEDSVRGAFQIGDIAYPFTAVLNGDTLTLTTPKATYSLKAQPPAAPPVAAPAAVQAAAPVVDAPAGYAVVNRTAAGLALAADKPGVTAVHAAMVAALADLAPLFDAKPAVVGAYEDSRDRRSGGLTFTAAAKGKPLRGLITTRLLESGATVAVVYAKADATADELKALTAAPKPDAAAPKAPKTPQEIAAAIDAVRLDEYQFPDGTGSTGVAEGWTTATQSALDCNYIQGPAGQHLAIGASFSIALPNSRLAQMGNPQMLVAGFDDPADALAALVPQLSAVSERAGSGTMRLDKVIDSQRVDGQHPGERVAIVNYLITHDVGGHAIQTRNNAKITCRPPGPVGLWSLYMVEMTAPVDTWEQDVPTMLAMMRSRRENVAACQQVDAQRQQAIIRQGEASRARLNAQFEAGQARHRAQMASYDAYNRQVAVNQNRIARSNDNFVEAIRGTRTVIDTQTNTKWDADLSNVDGLVNGLNASDPGRFVQVPFRDEQNPLIGR